MAYQTTLHQIEIFIIEKLPSWSKTGKRYLIEFQMYWHYTLQTFTLSVKSFNMLHNFSPVFLFSLAQCLKPSTSEYNWNIQTMQTDM